MIIPIFIRMSCDNESSEIKHGYGCKCSECLEKEKMNNKPKEFYKYRYAVPLKFILKNVLLKIIFWLIALIGILIIFSPFIFLKDFANFHFLALPLILLFGFTIFISAYILGDKLIKYNFQCKDKIYIEIKNYSSETWNEKIKLLNIPNNYRLTKENSSWRYK